MKSRKHCLKIVTWVTPDCASFGYLNFTQFLF